MLIAKWLFDVIIACPFIMLAVSYWFFNAPDSRNTFEVAADVTTPLLIGAVLFALPFVGQHDGIRIVVMICASIACIMLILELLVQKRLAFAVIKRIWRVYFLIFSMLYCGIWIFWVLRVLWI